MHAAKSARRRPGCRSPARFLFTGLAALAAVSCGTFHVNPAYVETKNYPEPVDMGKGRTVSLTVEDSRSSPFHLGTTQDIYHQEVVSDRPARDIVDDAFRQVLAESGYLLKDDADASFLVDIRDFGVTWEQSFGGKVVARVSLRVSVEQGGEMLGSKVFAENSCWQANPATSNGVPEAHNALSVCLSWVVQ